MQAFLDAITAGASGEDIAAIPIPESYRAALVRKDEKGMFDGQPSDEKEALERRESESVTRVAQHVWAAVAFVFLSLLAGRFLRPNNPTAEKAIRRASGGSAIVTSCVTASGPSLVLSGTN